MASIDYPDSVLPGPLVSNASHVETQRLLRTDMDSGYAVVRKQFTQVPVNFNIQLLLTQPALSYFQAWFSGTLDYGLNWFNMDLPVGDALLSQHECRFLSNPKYTLDGVLWRVTAKIEALELNLGVDYDTVMQGVIATLGGFDLASTYFDNLDVAINDTYPASGYGPDV